MTSDSPIGWAKSFKTLNKNICCANLVNGYDVNSILSRFVKVDANILDLGCGNGNEVLKLQEAGFRSIYGCDPLLSFYLGENVQQKFLVTMNSNEVIPFDSDLFDLVYCRGVLHHIEPEKYESIAREIRRVLKPNGIFFFIEPRKSLLRSMGHVVILKTPLGLISPFRELANCLKSEWPTYQPWLSNWRESFIPLMTHMAFQIEEYHDWLLTSVYVFRKTKII